MHRMHVIALVDAGRMHTIKAIRRVPSVTTGCLIISLKIPMKIGIIGK